MMAILAFLFLLFASPVHAESYSCSYGANGASRTFTVDPGYEPVCTMSFTFSGGPCDGQDMVTRWTKITRVDGAVINDWRMRPWTQTPILIRSFLLSKISGGPHGNMMVGNSYVNDAMVSFGPAETAMWAGTPPGTGVPFPGISNDPGDAYFDLHGSCTGGGTASFRVDIAYTPQTNPPPPPPGTVTWSPSDKGPNIVLSDGYLSASGSASFNSVRASLGHSAGKFHWENVVTAVSPSTSVVGFGTASMSLSSFVGNSPYSVGVQSYGGQVSASGFTCNAGVPFSAGDVQTFEIDLDAKKIWLAKNGVFIGGGDPASGLNPWCIWAGALTLFPAWSSADSANMGLARFAGFTTPLSEGFLPWQ